MQDYMFYSGTGAPYVKGKKNQNLQSASMNNMQLRMYQRMLVSLACATIKWHNMPDEIDERFLNMTLINRGLSVFFRDDIYDKYFACTATQDGKINMYNNPTGFVAYGASGFNRRLKARDCVPIWYNYAREPELDSLSIYARRLADIDRTVDVNLANAKQPIFVTIPEAQRLTIENAMKMYYGNEPLIIGADGTFDPSLFGYLTPDINYITDKLLVDKGKIWNEIMTYLGIDNTNMEKRERTNTEEVQANDGQIEAMRLTRLDPLRYACEEINRKFGLNVWVDFNYDLSSRNFEFDNSHEEQSSIAQDKETVGENNG